VKNKELKLKQTKYLERKQGITSIMRMPIYAYGGEIYTTLTSAGHSEFEYRSSYIAESDHNQFYNTGTTDPQQQHQKMR
jgi:hypothetical protein